MSDRQVSGLTRLARLTRKELRETLRDRRTMVTLVVMPLLVYPLLSIIFHQFLLSGASGAKGGPQETINIVGVGSAEDDQALAGLLVQSLGALRERPRPSAGILPSEASVESPLDETSQPKNLFIEVDRNYLERLEAEHVDAAVEMRWDRERENPQVVGMLIHYRPDSPRSRQVADLLQRRFRVLNEVVTEARLVAARLPPRPLVSVNLQPLVVANSGSAFSLSALIPVVLVLMTVTGAVYPAIDLTAGERERNTLECLIAAPIARIQLLLAKYIAVLTVALLTAGVNLLGMLITLRSTGVGEKLLGSSIFTVSNFSAVLALLVLFAAFYSAVLLAITSFARSFKEAQAYLIPLMLLSLGPALASLMPGMTLGPLTSVMPLINVVLLARDLLGQPTNLPLLYGGIAVVSTLVYAAAALTLAARIFGSDSILYGSEQSWSDLFRRPEKVADAPTPSLLAGCLAFLFPLYVLSAGTVSQMPNLDLKTRLVANAVLTFALFAWLPAQFATLRNVRWSGAFAWRMAPPLTFVGAVILGLSLWPIAHELVLLSHRIGLANLTQERLSQAGQMVAQFRQVPLALVLLCLAIAPAICEELFFRGFLLSALRRHVDATAAIAISATSFGLFHTVAGHILTPERLLSTTFLGLFLAWIAWRTQSVLPGIALHVVNNALLLIVAHYSPQLEAAYGISSLEADHLPASWLAGGVAGMLVGATLVWLGSRKPQAV